MKYTDNGLNIVTTYSLKGIGKAWISNNLQGNEPIDVILSLLNKKIVISKDNFMSLKNIIKEEILSNSSHLTGLTAIGDMDFPSPRGNIPHSDKPCYLLYKGDLSLLDKNNKVVSVIGSRLIDKPIIDLEKTLVRDYVKRGYTILSGLALGADIVAHDTCVKMLGKTIVTLPSPIHDILPMTNGYVIDDVIKYGGLLISEYYYKHKERREIIYRLTERSRLQAIYTDKVILIASMLNGGSRHAVNKAKLYGVDREVLDISKMDTMLNELNNKLMEEGVLIY